MGKKKNLKKRSAGAKIARYILKFILYAFLCSIFYILFCKWINPPITITQIGSLVHGNGLHRDYVNADEMNANIKLAVLSGEDQLFLDHNGFDFK
ncbi:MAG: monofunctional biosynthetic peptidoglycan transglycosylase, partial [Ginsengibacter sp.]